MPREIVHWDILNASIAELETKGTEVVNICLNEFKTVALLGAIVHDAPYYANWGKDHNFAKIAKHLHGDSGEDSFEALKGLAKQIVKVEHPRVRFVQWAFLMGMVTHYITDINFHPLIFYFTGNYSDEDDRKRLIAQTKHRLFEVHLDSWFKPRLKRWNDCFIYKLLARAESDLPSLYSLLEQIEVQGLVEENKTPITSWKSSIKCFSDAQRAFRCLSLGALVRAVNCLTKGRYSHIDVLFSFNRVKPQDFFDSPITYKNPVTGEKTCKSVLELREQSIKESVALLRKFEPLISQQEHDVEKVFHDIKGKSLSYGVYGAHARDMKIMTEDDIPMLNNMPPHNPR